MQKRGRLPSPRLDFQRDSSPPSNRANSVMSQAGQGRCGPWEGYNGGVQMFQRAGTMGQGHGQECQWESAQNRTIRERARRAVMGKRGCDSECTTYFTDNKPSTRYVVLLFPVLFLFHTIAPMHAFLPSNTPLLLVITLLAPFAQDQQLLFADFLYPARPRRPPYSQSPPPPLEAHLGPISFHEDPSVPEDPLGPISSIKCAPWVLWGKTASEQKKKQLEKSRGLRNSK